MGLDQSLPEQYLSRLKNFLAENLGNSGMGLAIVRHIALLHRGMVEVESRAGEGSFFRLRIPVS